MVAVVTSDFVEKMPMSCASNRTRSVIATRCCEHLHHRRVAEEFRTSFEVRLLLAYWFCLSLVRIARSSYPNSSAIS